MCGIAGYFGNERLPESRIQSCLKLMHRRGPDYAAHRHWVNPAGKNVDLLHARLSIIDLDPRSNQPFQVGSKSICFNGELYNYLELEKELKAKGFQPRTSSDTEVLLQAIATEGWEVLDRCEGMWAFAVYDEKDGTLALSRDRFAEKPLFLYRDAQGLTFGSEVKFIVALLGRKLEVNYSQLYRFLVNGYKSIYKRGQTFFQGLEELPRASLLQVDAQGKAKTAPYWTPRFAQNQDMSYADAVAGARERLLRSVQLRLRADVPLAFCMSGGVDSNSLISIAKNVFNYDVHGFTVVNFDKRYEEQEMVDYVVKELKIRHSSTPVQTTDFIPRLRELVRQHDAPVYTITYYAHWLLMKSIADQGYRISISGTAADELFSGYYDHHLAYLYEVRNNPALQSASRKAWQEHIQPIVRNPYLRNPDLFSENPRQRDYIYLNSDGFSEYLQKPFAEPFHEELFTPDILRNRMANEIFFESMPVILHEDDLNAMYYSIENRSPFLDRSLFEFCNTIPTKHLIRDGMAKAVLRDAMRGIVPTKVLDNRKKVGFNAPIYSFLDVEDPAVRDYLLDKSPVFDHIRREKVVDLIQKPDLRNSESKFLFYFLNTKMFLEEFAQ